MGSHVDGVRFAADWPVPIVTVTDRCDYIKRIGRTPLVPIKLRMTGRSHRLMLKLEAQNPGGSVKDRTALSLLRSLERTGLLRRDARLIESTSGNLGIALAQLAAPMDYRFIAVIDPNTPSSSRVAIAEAGAHVEVVGEPDDVGNYLSARLERVWELLREDPTAVWTDQYKNRANPRAHFLTTGPEMLRQSQGRLPVVFVAVSTGGTLAGIASYLRIVSPRTRIVAVDVQGSTVLGGVPGPRRLTGMGSSRRSSFVSGAHYDEVIYVRDSEAFACCRTLAEMTGLMVGGSSGAVIAAAVRYFSAHPDTTSAAALCPDDGKKYTDTIFDDRWIAEIGAAPLKMPPLVPGTDDVVTFDREVGGGCA